MKRLIIILATIVVLVVLSLLVVGFESQRKGSVTPTPSLVLTQTQTPIPTSAASPTVTPKAEANIIVTSPKSGQEVTLPFTISGRARVFENQFNYQLLNAAGTVIYQGQIYANSPDAGQYGDFSVSVASVSSTARGLITVEVFDFSPKDGSKIDLVKVPVTLK